MVCITLTCIEEGDKILNFMPPHPPKGKNIKLMYFIKIKIFFILKHISYKLSNDGERVLQNFRFHDPQGRGSCASPV